MAWDDNYQPGRPYNQSVVLAERSDVVMQRLVAGTTGVHGYTVGVVPPNTIVFNRRFTPMWAVIVAIVGFLLFLIGLLALLAKQTETFTITLLPEGDGTRVNVTGPVSVEMIVRLNSLLGLVPMVPGMPMGAPMYPPGGQRMAPPAPGAPGPAPPAPPPGGFTE